jgi:hypothetical protein
MRRLASTRSHLVYVLLFLALSSGFIGLQSQRSRRRPTRFRVHQHLTRLRELCPDLHIVENMPGRPEGGVYISVQPRKRRKLLPLLRNPERIASWHGTVFAEDHAAALKSTSLAEWQGVSFVAGETVFFGDPELLERLQAVLNDQTY